MIEKKLESHCTH